MKSKLTLRHIAAAAALVSLMAPGLAGATTAGNTFQATVTVISSCTVSGTTLNFGNSIDALATGTPLDATSALSVQCTNTTPYTVALNAGTNAGGASNFSTRLMKSGSNSLAYQLYLDNSRATVWGDGTASSSTLAGTGTGNVQTINIYGRLPSLANVVPGSYTDTVTVTVSY